MEDGQRRSSIPGATFSLTATMIGGGILSLPFAFVQAGVVLAPCMFLAAMVGTIFSEHLLVTAARVCGKTSFDSVAEAAFQRWGKVVSGASILVNLMFALVGYEVLVRDILSGVIEFFTGTPLGPGYRSLIPVATSVFLAPLYLQKSLTALQYTSCMGYVSTIVLSIILIIEVVIFRAARPKGSEHGGEIAPWPQGGWTGALMASPIITLAFLCQHNTLPVCGKLSDPSPRHCTTVIVGSVTLVGLVYLAISLAGILSSGHVEDNIFLSFPSSDPCMIAGRIAFTINLLCVLPVQLIPARDVAISLCKLLFARDQFRQGYPSMKHPVAQYSAIPSATEEQLSGGIAPVADVAAPRASDTLARALAGLSLAGFSAFMAVRTHRVGLVWSLCGSTVGFFISFFLPPVVYLTLREKEHYDSVQVGAWVMLLVSIPLILVCTTTSLYQAYHTG